MIFMGSFLGADELTIPITPTSFENITYTELQDGEYNFIYVTNKAENRENDSSNNILPVDKPNENDFSWDYDTIMFAKFNDNTLAGNISEAISEISNLLIKRREKGTFEWTTIYAKEIKGNAEDLSIVEHDLTAKIGVEYEYAAVPTMSGIESSYAINTATCESKSLIIADADEVWSTYITDGFCDYTRTYPVNMLQTLYSRYPTAVRNTYQNYDIINVSGSWVPRQEDGDCRLEYIDTPKMVLYQKAFINFLTNGKPKLLKNIDGSIWLCSLSGDISNSAEDIYNDRNISFQMTEIGDVENRADMFNSGFNPTATSEWW